jgi:uncharacterized protein (DUF427 family)
MTTTTTRPVLQPGPDHTLVLEKTAISVRVAAGATVLAKTASALKLKEHVYPVALYIDRNDIDMSRLERSTHTSWCPYKGEANYFHIVGEDGQRYENAVWTYEAPFENLSRIKDRLAFYTDRVTVTQR